MIGMDGRSVFILERSKSNNSLIFAICTDSLNSSISANIASTAHRLDRSDKKDGLCKDLDQISCPMHISREITTLNY